MRVGLNVAARLETGNVMRQLGVPFAPEALAVV
jgi:hypothetical protein